MRGSPSPSGRRPERATRNQTGKIKGNRGKGQLPSPHKAASTERPGWRRPKRVGCRSRQAGSDSERLKKTSQGRPARTKFQRSESKNIRSQGASELGHQRTRCQKKKFKTQKHKHKNTTIRQRDQVRPPSESTDGRSHDQERRFRFLVLVQRLRRTGWAETEGRRIP
jgi:hypothetical protein